MEEGGDWTTECQMALDAFGFIVVAILNKENAERIDREGMIDEIVHHRDYPPHQLRAKLIGPATFEEWKRQNDLWGAKRFHGFHAFRKFIVE